MKLEILSRSLLATILVLSLSGCLVHQTVTRNGEEVRSGYAFKRPVKEAIDNSH